MGKVFTMTTGELNYDGYGDLQFNWLNYVLYCTFVILMPIVFMNLLTSLAISDVSEIEKNAKFRLVKLQMDAAHAIQKWLPERFIEFINVFMFQQFLSIVRDFLFSEYLYVDWDESDEHYFWQRYLKKSSDNPDGSSQGSKIEKLLSRLG